MTLGEKSQCFMLVLVRELKSHQRTGRNLCGEH
jgi:hypothetical protein